VINFFEKRFFEIFLIGKNFFCEKSCIFCIIFSSSGTNSFMEEDRFEELILDNAACQDALEDFIEGT